MTPLRRLGLVGLGALLVAAAAGAAWASHYRLPANGLVDAKERAALEAQGIADTKRLLERTTKLSARKALAKATRIPLLRVTELAQKCDLLRVSGVGPTMMRLLRASGVAHSGELARRDAESLAAKMRQVNATKGLSEVVPGGAVLADWIGQAQRMPRILE